MKAGVFSSIEAQIDMETLIHSIQHPAKCEMTGTTSVPHTWFFFVVISSALSIDFIMHVTNTSVD